MRRHFETSLGIYANERSLPNFSEAPSVCMQMSQASSAANHCFHGPSHSTIFIHKFVTAADKAATYTSSITLIRHTARNLAAVSSTAFFAAGWEPRSVDFIF